MIGVLTINCLSGNVAFAAQNIKQTEHEVKEVKKETIVSDQKGHASTITIQAPQTEVKHVDHLLYKKTPSGGLKNTDASGAKSYEPVSGIENFYAPTEKRGFFSETWNLSFLKHFLMYFDVLRRYTKKADTLGQWLNFIVHFVLFIVLVVSICWSVYNEIIRLNNKYEFFEFNSHEKEKENHTKVHMHPVHNTNPTNEEVEVEHETISLQ